MEKLLDFMWLHLLPSFHRITEWPGLEGTSRIMNLQPPCQTGPPTSPFTRPGYPGPHPSWPWTPPGTGHPQPLWAAPGKELPPNIQPKSSLFQLKTIPLCHAVIYPFKEFTPFLFIGSLQVLKGCNEVTPQPSPGWVSPAPSACLCRGGAPAPWSSLWPSSGPSPTAGLLQVISSPFQEHLSLTFADVPFKYQLFLPECIQFWFPYLHILARLLPPLAKNVSRYW